MATKQWSSTAPPGEFRPYVGPEESVAEFSLRAVILGSLFGVLFGAVSVYVGLRAGLTVSASIPIAVLSISILRAFGRSTILENNIVQTTGSAGESAAAGVIFSMPALIFLGFSLNAEYWRIFFLALMGGWLGVLFMIPLRRQLIVKEHGNLTFPEGTACADVLVAGERGGSFAGRVFWGLGLGGLYTFAMNTLRMWPSQPDYQPKWLPGASFRANITSEYLGVGYIIGPRVSGTLFAGGVISWLVIMPAIKFFGSLSGNVALYPSTIPIGQMTSDQLYSSYIRSIGAGAVAASGLITLIKTLPTIFSALSAGIKDIRAKQAAASATAVSRTERDMSMRVVLIGSVVIVAMMWALLKFKPIPGAMTSGFSDLLAALFVVVFGFLFVTVASRISGLIGNSSNPISGMTIATLMATCAVFLVIHWTSTSYQVLALTIGGVVCIASAIAGATSQDLKTGYLVGATPYWQQVALVIGVMVSSFAIGGTLILMNIGLAQYKPVQIALDIDHLQPGVDVQERGYTYNGKTYTSGECARLARSAGRKIFVRSRYASDRSPVGAGNRQRSSGGAAGQTDGDGDQRHLESAIAVAAGVSGCVLGDRGGAAGRALAAVRGRLLSFDRHHHGNVRRRPGALAGRARPGKKDRRGERSESGLSVRERINCSRWRLRPASDRAKPAPGSRAEQARPALAGSSAASTLARKNVRPGRKIPSDQQRSRRRRPAICPASDFAIHFRTKKIATELKRRAQGCAPRSPRLA